MSERKRPRGASWPLLTHTSRSRDTSRAGKESGLPPGPTEAHGHTVVNQKAELHPVGLSASGPLPDMRVDSVRTSPTPFGVIFTPGASNDLVRRRPDPLPTGYPLHPVRPPDGD